MKPSWEQRFDMILRIVRGFFSGMSVAAFSILTLCSIMGMWNPKLVISDIAVKCFVCFILMMGVLGAVIDYLFYKDSHAGWD